jgi:GTPase SAR1 family protein
VVLVGPDGVGKTSTARALISQFPGPTGYFHFRPPVLGDMAVEPPEEMAPARDKNPPAGPRMLGWLRIAKHVVVCWLGHILTVRPALRAGALVVGDRWSFGYLVQPRALRFYGPTWLAIFALRILPRPDLVVNLTAPVEEIRRRKQELSEPAIRGELRAWSDMEAPNLVTLSAEMAPHEVAGRILARLGW